MYTCPYRGKKSEFYRSIEFSCRQLIVSPDLFVRDNLRFLIIISLFNKLRFMIDNYVIKIVIKHQN